ncbi:putative pentatricopeptide [Rosa chinensis]|uniref:Putative pentatricopeptide n=1 Tax=Rosa chinensis TaxID=74649 RepID=A0A2P6QI44_ROSCH|nr:putative pentatricopeptide [Rosa chinensis]
MMMERDIEPDTITYSALMDGYCLRGEMDQAREVFDLMPSKGSMVNAHSYNILINGYCKHKYIDEAVMLFEAMSRKGLFPDTVTYNTLMDGFCKMEGKRCKEVVLRDARLWPTSRYPNLCRFAGWLM